MKKVILLLFIISIPFNVYPRGNEKIKVFEGKVEYFSSQYTYVRFENTDGLHVGDTLFIKIRGKYIPCMTINSLSSRSCAAINFGDKIEKGTSIFGFLLIQDEILLNVKDKELFNEIQNSTSGAAEVDTTEFIGFKKMDKSFSGKFSVSGYSNLSNTVGQDDYQNWRYSLTLNAENINNGPISFSNYTSFRYRADEWNYISSNIEEALRIYDLSIDYEFSSSINFIVGRKINRLISNIGAVDGLQINLKYKAINFGAILGSRPDYSNYGFNLNLLQMGAYANRKDSVGNGAMENSISVIQQMKNSSTDRRFLYFQHSNNIFEKTSLFISSELDLFELEKGKAKNDLRFTSIYFSLQYTPKSWISTSFSYDARKNVIYYETFKNYAHQLIESALRQGFRFRINIRPIKYIFANAYAGYRFRDDDKKQTRNFGGTLTYSRIPKLNASISINYLSIETSYLNGSIYGVRVSKDLFEGIIYSSVGYKNVNYQFVNTDSELVQNILQTDLSVRIIRSISLSINYEGIFEEQASYSNVYVNLSTRF